MWIISDKGFVSLVQHDDDPSLIRARARRKQHLLDTFPDLTEDDIIDYGPTPPDYRFHANVDREEAAEAVFQSVMDIEYTSHVKESVSAGDKEMYRAMMTTWSAFYELQRPPRTDGDWWISRDDFDDEEHEDDEEFADHQRIHGAAVDRLYPRGSSGQRRLLTPPLPRGRGFDFPGDRDFGFRSKRDDGRADKPLEELTGSLADRMLQSAGRMGKTTPIKPIDVPPSRTPASKKAARKIPPPPKDKS